MEGFQRYTGRIDIDGSISFRGYTLPADGDGMTWRPAIVDHRAVVSHVHPGESFEGESFEYWRAFLEERGGAATAEMISDHINPPDFPCPPEGCPQHPRDDYHDMSPQLEHWSALLCEQARSMSRSQPRVAR